MFGPLAHRDRLAASLTVAAAVGLLAMLAVRVRELRGPLNVDAVSLQYLGRPATTRHLSPYHLDRLDGPLALRVLVWFGSPWAMVLTVSLLALIALACGPTRGSPCWRSWGPWRPRS